GERDQPRLDRVRWHVPGDVGRGENGQCRAQAVADDQDLIAAGRRGGQIRGDVVTDELVDVLKSGANLPEPADRTVVVGYRVDIGDPFSEVGGAAKRDKRGPTGQVMAHQPEDVGVVGHGGHYGLRVWHGGEQHRVRLNQAGLAVSG